MSYSDRDRVYAWLDSGNGEKLTTLDRAILVTIAERANSKTGLSAPGIAEIAQRWGVIPKSVDRSISRLHRFGLVDTVTRGRGQHRARYTLTGEVAPPAGGPTSTPEEASSSPEMSSSTPETSSSSPGGGTVLSESSRSSYEVMTTPKDDDALPRAPLTGARQRGQDDARKSIPADLVAYVAQALEMRTDEATTWAESKLDGHTVRKLDNYIRRCVENYSPPKPKLKPEASNGSKTRAVCDFHWQEQPCSGCAADRKVAGVGEIHPAYKPAGIRTLENIAAILGVQPTPVDDDDDGNQQIEITRADVDLGVYTNLPAQHITIYSNWNMEDLDKRPLWPRSALPDEPFRDRAIQALPSGDTWEYRPHDAVELVERWHELTSNVDTKTPAWRAVETIASLLGAELTYEGNEGDDETEPTVAAQRAGLDFIAWTSKTARHVTIICERADTNLTWPEGKPLPDERFHHRAISNNGFGLGGGDYHPADAIAIAEHWHEQTGSIETEIPA